MCEWKGIWSFKYEDDEFFGGYNHKKKKLKEFEFIFDWNYNFWGFKLRREK
jgi:hypothetical protein